MLEDRTAPEVLVYPAPAAETLAISDLPSTGFMDRTRDQKITATWGATASELTVMAMITQDTSTEMSK